MFVNQFHSWGRCTIAPICTQIWDSTLPLACF